MKKVAFAVAGIAVAAFLAASASAQVARVEPKPVLSAKIDEMKTVLKLSDEQVKKMMDLFEQTEKAKKDLAAEFVPVKADYDKAVAAQDQAAIKAATDRWVGLWKKQTEVNAQGGADISSVLTTEQLTQWLDYKFLAPLLKGYEKDGITDDQLTKIMAEFKRVVAEGNPNDEMQFRMQVYQKLGKIIDKEVLTDEQRQKRVLDPILAQYKSANLTDAQIAKIKDQAQTLVKGLGPDEPLWAAMSKLGSFAQTVLTDEQRELHVLNPILSYYKRADLTDEQTAKIKEKYKALVKEAKPEDPPFMINMKLSTFIPEVLTDEQRQKLGFPAAK